MGPRSPKWVPGARLLQPANWMWDGGASAFPIRSQLPFDLLCPSGKRYAIKGGSIHISSSWCPLT